MSPANGSRLHDHAIVGWAYGVSCPAMVSPNDYVLKGSKLLRQDHHLIWCASSRFRPAHNPYGMQRKSYTPMLPTVKAVYWWAFSNIFICQKLLCRSMQEKWRAPTILSMVSCILGGGMSPSWSWHSSIESRCKNGGNHPSFSPIPRHCNMAIGRDGWLLHLTLLEYVVTLPPPVAGQYSRTYP